MKKMYYLALGMLVMVTAVLTGCKSESPSKFVLATYNIRFEGQGDYDNGNGWSTRRDYVSQLIRFHGFDIFGTQEGLHNQLEDLKDRLPGFDYIGVGREDGKEAGEFAAIFYRTEMFELLDHGDFWLSTVTDRPNVGWDAALPRVCTWGKFRMKESGFTFIYYNLHMDHIGKVARREAAKLVMARITQMTDGGKKLAVLTGDFNVPQTDELYSLFTESGVLKDCYASAQVRFAENGTYNGFDYHFHTANRIDHILVTPATIVDAYAILTDGRWQKDSNGVMSRRNLSDHYPVFARIHF